MVFRRLGKRVRNLLSKEQSLELRLAEHRAERTPLEFTDEEFYANLVGTTASLDEARAQARSGNLRQASIHLWEHFHDRIRPRFFLHPAELDSMVEVLREHTADCRRLVREADQTVSHTFCPLGSEPYHFPAAIDWFSDFQGKSWVYAHVESLKEQLGPQGSLADGMGSIGLTWEFNTHGHFQDLARAYWISGNEPFASEFIVQVVDWSERNPTLFGVNWLNPQTVATRAFHWLQATQLFMVSAQLQGEVFARLLKTILLHGGVLADLLDTSPSPRVSWAASLYLLASTLPELAPTTRWLNLARAGLENAAAREFGRDGMHLSGSTSHHRESLEWLLLVLALDFLNGRPPDSLHRAAETALEAMAYLRPPNGMVAELGAAAGPSLLGRHAGPSEHTHRLLALGAVVLGREDMRYQAQDFPAELYWWLGPDGPNLLRSLERSEPQGIRRSFPEVGLAVCRDHWGPRSNWCLLRAMPEEASREYESNELTPPAPATAPWHDDYLSLCLSLEGEPVLMEPGVPGLPGPVRDMFSRISSHSAVRVGREMEPLASAPPDGSRIPRTVLEPTKDGGFFMSAARPVWIMPDRPWLLTRELLFLPKKQRLVIRDHLEGEGEVHLESNLLLAHHLDVLMRGDMGCLLRGKKLQARVIPLFPGRFRYELCKGRTNPFSGWTWAENRRPVPANLLRYYARLNAPATIVLYMVWNPDDTTVPRPQDVEKMFRLR